MEIANFTEADTDCSLGAHYRASSRLANDMLQKFEAEHLKPLVERVADEFREKLWDDVRDWLLCDTELNVAGAVNQMVEQTVDALLTGEQWAMDRYPFADYSRGEKIRKAVAQHGGENLLSKRIADLESEIAKRDETIRFLRRDYP